jgi:hypothetical protein
MSVPNLINVSSSVSTRATTLENANISGGFVAQTVLSGSGTLISGSATSTGSFGAVYSSGNVGIGTTGPTGVLDVYGTGASTQLVRFNESHATATSTVLRISRQGTTKHYIDLDGTDSLNISAMMYISGSGQVGIGTTVPSAKLHIVADSTNGWTAIKASGQNYFYTSTGDGSELRYAFNPGGSADGGYQDIYKADASTIGVRLNAGGSSYFTGGNVGIGTVSPEGPLHVATANVGTAHGDWDTLVLEENGRAGITIISSNDNYGAIDFADGDGTEQGMIQYLHSTNDMYLKTAGTSRIFISGSGNVGINYSNPTTKLWVRGINGETACMLENTESGLIDADRILRLDFTNNDGNPDDDGHFIYAHDKWEHKYSVYSDGDTFSKSGDDIAVLSDGRLKENITDYSDGLAFINSLKPRKFNWKEGINRSSDTQYGFIAQELEEVSDKSMRLYKKRNLAKEASEHKYIDDGVLYTSQLKTKDAQYVSAIQELHTIIQELSAKVEALENA